MLYSDDMLYGFSSLDNVDHKLDAKQLIRAETYCRYRGCVDIDTCGWEKLFYHDWSLSER